MQSPLLPSLPIDPSACYFTIVAPTYINPDDTTSPLDSPLHSPTTAATVPIIPLDPVEAISPPVTPSAVSRLLQMQTATAHANPPSSRPRPYPVQNVLQVSSDDPHRYAGSSGSGSSGSSSLSSSASSSNSSFTMARCSRCQRTPSVDVCSGKSNMVSYGLNLWYCSRCASLVGLNR